MSAEPVVIIGGGPCGIAAALSASQHAPVVLLDERPSLHGVDDQSGTAVWALLPGPTIAAFDDTHAFHLDASAVVIATGAVDVAWPVPGWRLPGVVTAQELRADLNAIRNCWCRRAGCRRHDRAVGRNDCAPGQ